MLLALLSTVLGASLLLAAPAGAFTISGTPANADNVVGEPITDAEYQSDEQYHGVSASCRAYCFGVTSQYVVLGECPAGDPSMESAIFSDAPYAAGGVYRRGGSPIDGKTGYLGSGSTSSPGHEQFNLYEVVDTRASSSTFYIYMICEDSGGTDTIGASYTMTFHVSAPTCPARETGIPPDCVPSGSTGPGSGDTPPTGGGGGGAAGGSNPPSGSGGGGNHGNSQSAGCIVPKLAGLRAHKVEAKLKQANCKLGEEHPTHPAPGSVVVRSEPSVGKILAAGTKVEVFFRASKKHHRHG